MTHNNTVLKKLLELHSQLSMSSNPYQYGWICSEIEDIIYSSQNEDDDDTEDDISNNEQTAVEWQHLELSKFINGKSEYTDAEDILIKAKEMEQKKIENLEQEIEDLKNQILEIGELD